MTQVVPTMTGVPTILTWCSGWGCLPIQHTVTITQLIALVEFIEAEVIVISMLFYVVITKLTRWGTEVSHPKLNVVGWETSVKLLIDLMFGLLVMILFGDPWSCLVEPPPPL